MCRVKVESESRCCYIFHGGIPTKAKIYVRLAADPSLGHIWLAHQSVVSDLGRFRGGVINPDAEWLEVS